MTKPFCAYHIATKENPNGTDCAAHLAEGQCFECPFDSPEHAQTARYPCVDYESLVIEPDIHDYPCRTKAGF